LAIGVVKAFVHPQNPPYGSRHYGISVLYAPYHKFYREYNLYPAQLALIFCELQRLPGWYLNTLHFLDF
jgi:hypothetical protein